MNTEIKAQIIYPEAHLEDLMPESGANSRWPNAMRGFPAFLIQSGVFGAQRESDHLVDQTTGNVQTVPSPSLLKLTKDNEQRSVRRDLSVREGNYTGPLSMRTFRVLLEIIELAKRSKISEDLYFSPKLAFTNLGLSKSGGTSYEAIEHELVKLTETHFLVDNPNGGISSLPLIEQLDTGRIEIKNFEGVAHTRNHDSNRFGKYRFQVGPLLQLLLNYAPLARVQPKILCDIGRSSLQSWVYCFYATHGGDGNLVFDIKIETLLKRSGVEFDLKVRTQKYLEQATDGHFDRRAQQSYFAKCLREKIYHFCRIIKSLSKLKIFHTISATASNVLRSTKANLNSSKRGTSPLIACSQRLIRVLRFNSDDEVKLWACDQVNRATLFAKTPFPLPNSSNSPI